MADNAYQLVGGSLLQAATPTLRRQGRGSVAKSQRKKTYRQQIDPAMWFMMGITYNHPLMTINCGIVIA